MPRYGLARLARPIVAAGMPQGATFGFACVHKWTYRAVFSLYVELRVAGRTFTFARVVWFMQYKGVEHSVVQLTEDNGWRWEVRFGEDESKIGLTRASRAAAIKLAKREIDRVLKRRQ